MDKLKATVIGVGEMGRHHARVYAQLPDVVLVAVADTDEARVRQVTRNWGAKAYIDHIRMLAMEKPDIVSVAVPTTQHLRVASACLLNDCHVLVEKPVAHTAEAARALCELAQGRGLVLAVGHIERCNPIVTEVKRRIDAGELGRIYRIGARRVGPSPCRIRDVGVTVDLLTHDLDVARYLLDSEPVAYHAELQRNRHGEYEDGVDALVRFANGVVGVFSADWLSNAKVRQLTVTGERGVICLDYLTQSLRLEDGGGVEDMRTPHEEPLAAQLRAFAAAARGEGRPAATGEDGLRALEMALAVLKAGSDTKAEAMERCGCGCWCSPSCDCGNGKHDEL